VRRGPGELNPRPGRFCVGRGRRWAVRDHALLPPYYRVAAEPSSTPATDPEPHAAFPRARGARPRPPPRAETSLRLGQAARTTPSQRRDPPPVSTPNPRIGDTPRGALTLFADSARFPSNQDTREEAMLEAGYSMPFRRPIRCRLSPAMRRSLLGFGGRQILGGGYEWRRSKAGNGAGCEGYGEAC
jgi:hypothetical protein